MYVWIIDQEENIAFLLGRALYMKAVHGGKTKNDKIDSLKIAKRIKGGNFPLGLCLSGENKSDMLSAQTPDVFCPSPL